MAENVDILDLAFKAIEGVTVLVVTIGGWLWTNLVKDVRAIQRQQDYHEREMIQHKLDAERTFASKSDVQSSLSRIHDRLDVVDQKLDDKFSEVGNDIKTILLKITKL